ncbi:MAG: ketoacid-CoA transferase, partial [Syntrophales bacterium]|nr:ketoacid-CoA transferase [Syntrophales bacterium]
MAVADPRVMYGAASNGGLLDAFATMQKRITGDHVIGILGAAQVDKYGNLNSTCIGDYYKPETRFSGSGGACDVASFVPRCIIFMQHEKRKFPNKVDYLTSPGYLDGPGGRERAGLIPDGGPTAVITNLGVMHFDDETKEMYLAYYYPGITPQKILDNMEFSVDVSRATEAVPPTERELKILRETVDPQKLIL